MTDNAEGEDEQLLRMLMRIEEQNGPPEGLDLREESDSKLARMHRVLRRIKRASSQTVAESDSLPCLPDMENSLPLERYRFIRRLGQGGFGVVFLAQDIQLNRSVAIKLPRVDILLTKSMVQRFLREAQNVARLSHPNIVPVLAIDELSPMPAIIYHFCNGPTLAEWLDGIEGLLDPMIVASIGVLLTEAIHHAHSRGVLHRDLKPSNILLEPATDLETPHSFRFNHQAWTPRIIDFGISKVIEENGGDTATNAMIGTLEYMSPEQLSGRSKDIGTHSDLYAIGLILYELLTKSRPYSESSPADRLSRLRAESTPSVRKRRLDVPRDFDAIIVNCLNSEPAQRYATASLLAIDLRNHLESKPVSVRSPSAMQRVAKWSRRQPVVATLSGVCALLAVFGIVATVQYIRHTNALLDELYSSNGQLKNANFLAEAERSKAVKSSQELRTQLYVTDIAAADQAFRDGDLTRYDAALRRQIIGEPGHDLRDGAWNYLWRKGHRPYSKLQVSRTPLYSIRFSDDGRNAALCGADGCVRIFDAQTRKMIKEWNAGQSEVNCATFSSDGQHLATTGDDGTICIWELQNHTCVQRFRAHGEHAFQAVFAKGDRVFTCGNEPTIRVWNWRTGEKLGSLEQHTRAVQSLALSADQNRLYSASDDNTCCVWDASSFMLLGQSEGVGARVVDVQLMPKRDLLYFSDVTGVVRCVSGDEPRASTQLLADLPDSADSIAVSATGRALAIASREGSVRLVDLDSEGNLKQEAAGGVSNILAAHGERIYDLTFSPDSAYQIGRAHV